MTSIGLGAPQSIAFEEAPLRPFHIRTVLSGTGGQFSDGYVLGIIGIAISLAAGPLQLTTLWLGLLGAASLAGLFIGSLITGPIADRFGRRPIFAFDMLLFTGISVLQFFVAEAWQLLVLRILLGVTLGADYVVSKSLVTEFAPRRLRGRLLSILAVAWAAGYVCAYGVGYMLHDLGADAWRWILFSSAVPSILIFFLRMGIPESPLWLVNNGRRGEAQHIIDQKLGSDIAAPQFVKVEKGRGSTYRQLFSPQWRRHTIVGGLFYTCQVIPFFAMSTFTPRILEALNVKGSYTAGAIYNLFLMLGALMGLLIIDKVSRRSFLIVSFYLMACTLGALALWSDMPTTLVIVIFAAFAFILAAAVNLEFVYPPELFPTELRASGVGLAVAASRFGSAVTTFLLPIMVERFGIHMALGSCVCVTLIGAFVCQRWAPETSHLSLSSVSK